jgi:exodeoxyribonuclease V alpha subunit
MDIIDSKRVKTIHLEKIFRQAKRSLIVVNAHRVNHGQMPYTKVSSGWGDYEFLKHDDPSEALQTIKHLVSVEIPRKFGFDPLLDIQILTPMHRGVLGVFNLNTTLQTLLNPSQEGIFRGGYRLCIGDKVMQVRNNYELGVFNGDMGRLVSISNEGKEVEVDFDGRIVPFEASDLDELTLAYACSIHKSQGNEYPAVIIALHTQHFIMLQRNLLYTAITRGKRFVAIVGSTRAMVLAIKNVNKAQRYSLLRHRLMGLLCEKTEQTAFF